MTMQTSAGQQKFHPVSRSDIGSAGDYKYTEDVLALERCKPVDGWCVAHTSELNKVCPPLHVEAWAASLHDHPDQRFASYLISGLHEGFRIGFNRDSKLVLAARNLPSASEQKAVLDRIFQEERTRERFIGPFHPGEEWQINRMGVIPKSHTPRKWRLITDLWHPPGTSVNDGIDSRIDSLSYITVDDVVSMAAKLGKGALLAKVDIESAYRLFSEHQDNRPLLAL